VLVVDDEEDVAFTIKAALERNGFDVDVFYDPILALSYFKAGIYDLLILDVKMPKMNGFELYKKIMTIDGSSKVCFLTAFDIEYFEEFKRTFSSLPTGCFIKKPVSMESLPNIIWLQINR
jgi:DNA-binding response OmpR family regulator